MPDWEARFWPKVNKEGPIPDHRPDLGPCWIWIAGRSGGYGDFALTQQNRTRAHRTSYELLVGPIPEGMQLDHLCRVRHCVNPSHVEPVTQFENIFRGQGISAVNKAKTRCIHGHPFSGSNLEIQTRVRRTGRRVVRMCRTCRKRMKDAAYAKRRALALDAAGGAA